VAFFIASLGTSFIISQMTTFLVGFYHELHPLCSPVSSVMAYFTFFNLDTFSDQVIQLNKHRNLVHLMANHRCWKYVVQMDLRMHGRTSLSSEELWVVYVLVTTRNKGKALNLSHITIVCAIFIVHQ
jgi:hypothetical membrane protein